MSRLGWLFRRRRQEDDLSAEIRAHLDEKVEELVARGLSREAALAEARRSFGNVTLVEEDSREVWRPPLMESVLADVRHALRLARRHPTFSANVILISALGIAACASTFSLVSGVLLAPLPFPDEDRVYKLLVQQSDRSYLTAAVQSESYRQIARGSPVIEAIAAYSPSDVTVQWAGEPEELDGWAVTPSFFRVFGVSPALGRPFAPDEGEESAAVVILSHRLWNARFAGDSTVIGRTIVLENATHVVVGVMPPGFRAHIAEEPAVWLPKRVPRPSDPRGEFTNAMLRVAPGATRQAVQSWLSTAVSDWVPARAAADSVTATPVLLPVAESIYGDVERPLQVLFGAVVLVLVLVSASVATLFVANSQSRVRELGVRRALGASTWRQLQQLVTESVTLTAVGGVLGVSLTYWIVTAVRTLGVYVLPRMDTVTLDWRVLVFAVVATMVTGLVGGLAPAVMAHRETSLVPTTARVTSRRTPSVLVVVQVTLMVVLLVGAGLLTKGFLKVVPKDPGFLMENRATVMVNLEDSPDYRGDDPTATRGFIREVSERLRAIPGVVDVAATNFVPFFGSVSLRPVRVPGRPEPRTPFQAFTNLVTPNYFPLMGIPVERGRAFGDIDVEGAEPVVIVNSFAAARFWPGEDPIGQAIAIDGRDDPIHATVIGIVRDARLFGHDTRVRPEVFLPVAQGSSPYITFVVHGEHASALMPRSLHEAVWSVAPRLPIGDSSDLATITMTSVRRPRFFAWAMGLFAAAAVALSALAVYSVLTLDVVQRRAEIGIRMAIGALPGRIGASVLGRAAVLGGAGMMIGLVLARGLSRYIESLLLEVTATDATVYTGTAVGALLLALAAACAPAWRAVRVDPVRSLRADA